MAKTNDNNTLLLVAGLATAAIFVYKIISDNKSDSNVDTVSLDLNSSSNSNSSSNNNSGTNNNSSSNSNSNSNNNSGTNNNSSSNSNSTSNNNSSPETNSIPEETSVDGANILIILENDVRQAGIDNIPEAAVLAHVNQMIAEYKSYLTTQNIDYILKTWKKWYLDIPILTTAEIISIIEKDVRQAGKDKVPEAAVLTHVKYMINMYQSDLSESDELSILAQWKNWYKGK